MSGKSSQRKGRQGELELSKILQAYGFPVEPGKPVSYGSTPDITGLLGIHAEVKRVERLNVAAAFAQAMRDSEKFGDGIPVLFHRRNRGPWLVTMELSNWVNYYKRAEMAIFEPLEGKVEN